MTDRTTYRQRVATVRGRARAQLAAIRKERLARMRAGPEISEEIAAAWAADRLEDTAGRTAAPPRIAVVPAPVTPMPEEPDHALAAGPGDGAGETAADACKTVTEELEAGGPVAAGQPVEIDAPAPVAEDAAAVEPGASIGGSGDAPVAPEGGRVPDATIASADHDAIVDGREDAAPEAAGPDAHEERASETDPPAGGSSDEVSGPDDDGRRAGAVAPAEEDCADVPPVAAGVCEKPSTGQSATAVGQEESPPSEEVMRASLAEDADAPPAMPEASPAVKAVRPDAGHPAPGCESSGAGEAAETARTAPEAPDAQVSEVGPAAASGEADSTPAEVDRPQDGASASVAPPAVQETQSGTIPAAGSPGPEQTDPSPPPGESDLHSIPGIGPGLVWMMLEAGVRTLDDLAVADPDDLALRLGAIARLLDLGYFITFARSRGVAG
jgi:predicted flap endonuclease-1-like 5' DNA nuclease